eukprot:3542053-Prymnesium_polylepis.1
MPSSQMRDVANVAAEASSNLWSMARWNSAIFSLSIGLPAFLAAAVCTCVSTLAACSPPITPIRAFGHIHMKRGE